MHNYGEFGILKVVTMKITDLWEVSASSLVFVQRRFGGTYSYLTLNEKRLLYLEDVVNESLRNSDK
jgi:hypothetical protein